MRIKGKYHVVIRRFNQPTPVVFKLLQDKCLMLGGVVISKFASTRAGTMLPIIDGASTKNGNTERKQHTFCYLHTAFLFYFANKQTVVLFINLYPLSASRIFLFLIE